MESKAVRVTAQVLAAAILLFGTANLRADAVSELDNFSVFGKVDPAQLASGDAKTMRGPAMSTPRLVAVETCWVSPGAPAQVAEALRKWNPAQHPELDIILHGNGSDFSRLQQAPDNGPVRALVAATASKSTELQISREEAAKLPAGNTMPGAIASFWSGVLSARAAAGPFSQPPYDHTGQAIRAGDEINGLLRQQPKIQKQFSGLISGKGEQYWELTQIEGKAVLTLGASYSRSTANGSFQAADVLYYASGGFYAGVTHYQIWPVDVGGKPSTLVWRGDMTSSAQIGETRGMERLGAESAMMKDVSRAVRLFRRDTGGNR
jgi:hypothetical protein